MPPGLALATADVNDITAMSPDELRARCLFLQRAVNDSERREAHALRRNVELSRANQDLKLALADALAGKRQADDELDRLQPELARLEGRYV